MDAATPSNKDRPLIVALAVETTPHGSINVTDQVLIERSHSGRLRVIMANFIVVALVIINIVLFTDRRGVHQN